MTFANIIDHVSFGGCVKHISVIIYATVLTVVNPETEILCKVDKGISGERWGREVAA